MSPTTVLGFCGMISGGQALFSIFKKKKKKKISYQLKRMLLIQKVAKQITGVKIKNWCFSNSRKLRNINISYSKRETFSDGQDYSSL